MTRFAILAAATAFLSACAVSAPKGQPPPPPDARITLARGGCGYIAACPGYAISLAPDGSYRYEGFRNVDVIGVREGKLAADSWARAEAVLAAAGWKTLKGIDRRDGGLPCMADSPFASIRRRLSDAEDKTFNYNLGCSSKDGDALIRSIETVLPLPKPPAPAPAAFSESSPFIRLYETPCYFKCATYEFTLNPSGAYRLNNIRDTVADGVTTGDLGPEAWGKAVAALDKAGFADLQAKAAAATRPGPDRPPCINDLPAIEVTRRAADGSETKVSHNTGCSLPEAITLRDDLRALFSYQKTVQPPAR